jgi:hypothetical protein
LQQFDEILNSLGRIFLHVVLIAQASVYNSLMEVIFFWQLIQNGLCFLHGCDNPFIQVVLLYSGCDIQQDLDILQTILAIDLPHEFG